MADADFHKFRVRVNISIVNDLHCLLETIMARRQNLFVYLQNRAHCVIRNTKIHFNVILEVSLISKELSPSSRYYRKVISESHYCLIHFSTKSSSNCDAAFLQIWTSKLTPSDRSPLLLQHQTLTRVPNLRISIDQLELVLKIFRNLFKKIVKSISSFFGGDLG